MDNNNQKILKIKNRGLTKYNVITYNVNWENMTSGKFGNVINLIIDILKDKKVDFLCLQEASCIYDDIDCSSKTLQDYFKNNTDYDILRGDTYEDKERIAIIYKKIFY